MSSATDTGTASAWAPRMTANGSRCTSTWPRQETFGVAAETRSTIATTATHNAATTGTSSS